MRLERRMSTLYVVDDILTTFLIYLGDGIYLRRGFCVQYILISDYI